MTEPLTDAAAAAIAPIVADDPDPDRLPAWVATQVGKFSAGDIDAGIEILRHHLHQTRAGGGMSPPSRQRSGLPPREAADAEQVTETVNTAQPKPLRRQPLCQTQVRA